MSEQKEITILLPRDLLKKVEERIKNTEFGNLSEYMCFILNEVVSGDSKDIPSNLSEHNEELKKRLQSLGYID